MIKERGSELGYTVWYCLLAVITFVIIVGSLYLFLPAALGFERQATVQSQSFVQSRQEDLIRKQAEYDALQTKINQARAAGNDDDVKTYTDQQRALATYMRQVEAPMPAGTIPSGVTVR